MCRFCPCYIFVFHGLLRINFRCTTGLLQYDKLKYRKTVRSWWRHRMETVSVLLTICAGNSPVTGVFSAQRPVTRPFDVFYQCRINGWASNHKVDDFRRHRTHYDVTVMCRYSAVQITQHCVTLYNVWGQAQIRLLINQKDCYTVLAWW